MQYLLPPRLYGLIARATALYLRLTHCEEAKETGFAHFLRRTGLSGGQSPRQLLRVQLALCPRGNRCRLNRTDQGSRCLPGLQVGGSTVKQLARELAIGQGSGMWSFSSWRAYHDTPGPDVGAGRPFSTIMHFRASVGDGRYFSIGGLSNCMRAVSRDRSLIMRTPLAEGSERGKRWTTYLHHNRLVWR